MGKLAKWFGRNCNPIRLPLFAVRQKRAPVTVVPDVIWVGNERVTFNGPVESSRRILKKILAISDEMWYNHLCLLHVCTAVIRPWRSWISQQIPILKAGGSNPSGRASREPRRASRVRGFSFYYDVALAFVVGIYFVNTSQLKAPMRKLRSELLFYPLDLWLFIYRRNVVLCKEILIYGVIFR